MIKIVQLSSSQIMIEQKFYDCVIGHEGFNTKKIEGDKTTPTGVVELKHIFYRKDRITLPESGLPKIPITSEMGWCDDPSSEFYNKLVKLPFKSSHEVLMREDELYDILITTSYNENPTVCGRGSAIFIHIMPPIKKYTAGCLGLRKDDLFRIIPMLSKGSKWIIDNKLARTT